MNVRRLSNLQRSSLWGIAFTSNIGVSTEFENYVRFAHQSKMLQDVFGSDENDEHDEHDERWILGRFLYQLHNSETKFRKGDMNGDIELQEMVMLCDMVVGARIIEKIKSITESSEVSSSRLYVLAVCSIIHKEDLNQILTGVTSFNKEPILRSRTI